VRSIRRGRRDELGVERAELAGDVGLERDAGLVAMADVDAAERLTATAGPEELSVRAGRATLPHPWAKQRSAMCVAYLV
jgi:hypothetical protein